MDATGIARQIVSLTSPGVQIFDAATGTALATSFNDQLAEACRKHPDRFSGLAAIAPQNPAAAAKELQRGVTKLGLKGAIINSNTHGEYLDDPKFWDILAAAESLDVPIYLHPATAPARMIGPMIEKGLEGAFYGFAVETSVHLLRMIMSGVFDRFPKLQVIAGHGGEGLPFWLCRFDLFQRNYAVNNRFPHMPKLKRKVSEYIKENIPITSSGMAWAPVIRFCQQVMGMDRVMYAMDYPYQYRRRGSEGDRRHGDQRRRQEEILPDQCGADLQPDGRKLRTALRLVAVSACSKAARVFASTSSIAASRNAGTEISQQHALGRPAQRQQKAAEQAAPRYCPAARRPAPSRCRCCGWRADRSRPTTR